MLATLGVVLIHSATQPLLRPLTALPDARQKRLLDRPGRHFAFVALFSRLSFRIYLVHMLVLFWLRSISPPKDLYTVAPELSIVVLGSITLAVSFAVAWGIDRLPRLRRWI